MSLRAWAYIWAVLLSAAVLSVQALPSLTLPLGQWLTFGMLLALATLAQFFEAEAPNRQSYYPAMVFFFAGVLVLHPFLFVLLIALPHVVEEAKGRLIDGRRRPWYIQPFNIANHILAGFVAQGLHSLIDADMGLDGSLLSVVSVTASAIFYVLVNHLLIGQALVLARGISWRASGVLAIESLMTDLVMMLLGYIVAVLWQVNPWLVGPALAPLVMIYRALLVPQLQQEAQTDAKTGLWNARHLNRLLTEELERAARFHRPLAVIVADLDLLRNINNTYGHLAGDLVLASIGRTIKATVREYDIAGRFGGEEFVIVLPEADLAEARTVAERLRQAVEATPVDVPTSLTPIGVTMSLGVAGFPDDGTDGPALIHSADVAVYQAKSQGRNQVVCADDVPQDARAAHVPVTGRGATPASTAST
jgi:diguanylate cyclase (GGDEF)-like protein